MIKRDFLPNNKQTSRFWLVLTYIFHKNRKYEILRNGLKLHRWVSPGLRLQLHGLSADCTMCNRIKWKLTTHSWSQRPDHRLTHIWCPGSWSVLISCRGRRNPRVADVAAFRTLPVSCLWRLGSGDTDSQSGRKGQWPVRFGGKIQQKWKTSKICMELINWKKTWTKQLHH